jgi:hypothetical protein
MRVDRRPLDARRGEEFVVLLPDGTTAHAHGFAVAAVASLTGLSLTVRALPQLLKN